MIEATESDFGTLSRECILLQKNGGVYSTSQRMCLAWFFVWWTLLGNAFSAAGFLSSCSLTCKCYCLLHQGTHWWYSVACEIVQLDFPLRGVDVAGNKAWDKGFYTAIT